MNIDILRSFVAISQIGSLSKTAEKMRVSQSTLTRQVQLLEQEIGGKLFERRQSGVALTAAGHTLFDSLGKLIPQLDEAIADTRRRARGQSGLLRIGYIMSAAAAFLNPALAAVRSEHPEVKVKLVDMSPGEQVAALRRGDLDVGLVGHMDVSLAREFYVKRLVSLPVLVALPDEHPLSHHDAVRLSDLRRELFVGAKEDDLPGYNRWVTQLCRRARFRPNFVEDADSLTHALSLLVAENAVTLLPNLVSKTPAPGVTCRPLDEPAARWDLQVAWQRGSITPPVRALIDALSKTAVASRPRAQLG